MPTHTWHTHINLYSMHNTNYYVLFTSLSLSHYRKKYTVIIEYIEILRLEEHQDSTNRPRKTCGTLSGDNSPLASRRCGFTHNSFPGVPLNRTNSTPPLPEAAWSRKHPADRVQLVRSKQDSWGIPLTQFFEVRFHSNYILPCASYI